MPAGERPASSRVSKTSKERRKRARLARKKNQTDANAARVNGVNVPPEARVKMEGGDGEDVVRVSEPKNREQVRGGEIKQEDIKAEE